MIDTTHASQELFAALAKAQGEVENASKTSSNPHFRSKYADLAEVLNTVRPVFSKHGLSVTQSTGFDGATVSVCTLIAHSGGGHLSSVASCVPAKTDAQGIGAATTYLRRYSLAAMAGVAHEDDDGNSAAHDSRPAAKDPDPAEAKILADLEAAAKAGPQALQMAFTAIPKSEAKARVWAAHGPRLKAMADEHRRADDNQPAPGEEEQA